MNIRWIIYISIISVLIWAELPAEIWQQTSYGRYTVIRMVHSPFPDTAYTDPAFQDSSVYIFVPRGYQKKAYYDLVIDHHGFGAIVDPANHEKTSYPESFRQDYQLFTSGKNAILIMPQAARNAANGATGKFGRMGGFQRFIEEIGTFLKHEAILDMNAALRDIHISSFSGGYQIMAMDITLNPPEFLTHIRSVNLWDSFYGYRDTFFTWALDNGRSFYSIYTPTGGTVELNRQLQDSLRTVGIVFDTLWSCNNRDQQRVIQYTHRSHNNVSGGGFTYAKYLSQLPLDDFGIRPPVLLCATPRQEGILITWNKQANPLLSGYRLWISSGGTPPVLLAGEDILTAGTRSFLHQTKTGFTYQIEAVGSDGSIRPALFSLDARAGDDLPHVLLVHAENRRLAAGIRGFDPDSFLYIPASNLTGLVGQNINQPFASCSNLAIEEGLVRPNEYQSVIWLAGNEQMADKIIDHNEKQWIREFLGSGGRLLISGNNVPEDLSSPFTSPPDQAFAEQIAGISGADSIRTDRSSIKGTGSFSKTKFSFQAGNNARLAFAYALVPVLLNEDDQIMGAIRKVTGPDNAAVAQTSTILTLAFSLALCEDPELQHYILAEFFTYARSGPLSPQPVVLPAALYLADGELHLGRESQSELFIISRFSQDRHMLSSRNMQPGLVDIDLAADSAVFIRIRGQSGAMLSRPSEMLGTSHLTNGDLRVLIVNGFDRITGSNSFDYCIEHGATLNRLNIDFDTATNEAVTEDLVRLTDYQLVDWILGEESSNDHTFTAAEQEIVAKYVDAGGKLLVSGAEIGWDLVEKAASPGDSLFFMKTLGAIYNNDNSEAKHFMFDGDSLILGGVYPVLYPDAISAARGSQILLRYDNDAGAAVGYRSINSGAVVLVAFPLETIVPANKRDQVFEYLIDYLMRSK